MNLTEQMMGGNVRKICEDETWHRVSAARGKRRGAYDGVSGI